jgi:hypothetical protein
MSSPRSRALLLVLLVAPLPACGTPAVLAALREERVKLGQGSAEVLQHAGPAELWIAKERVETLYYKNGEKAVFISLLDDKVIAYDDRAEWPAPAERAAKEADKPVSKGKIRVGLSEPELLAIMGKPSGMTAEKGIETFHWTSDDESDSQVELVGGKVVGYVDMETTKFSQNIPRHDRKNATTTGKVRVGMEKGAVQGAIGKPDGVSAKDGIVTHRYDASAFFGNDLVYYVHYRDDRVVGFSQENLTLAKKERKEQEAKAKEQQAAQESGPSAGGQVARVLFGFLLNSAVQAALAKRSAAPPPPTGGGGVRPGPEPVPMPMKSDTCSCPELQCGSYVKVQPCSARCVNTRASCSCGGQCPAEGRPSRAHTCQCR